MGQKEHWWPTIHEALNAILAPSGLTFEEFAEERFSPRKDGISEIPEKKGFSTPTGKVELYSTRMKEWGYDPLPQFREPPESPVSRPDLLEGLSLYSHYRHASDRLFPF